MRKWIENFNKNLLEYSSVIGEVVYLGTDTIEVMCFRDRYLNIGEIDPHTNKRHPLLIKIYEDEYDLLKSTLHSLVEKHKQEFIQQYENA